MGKEGRKGKEEEKGRRERGREGARREKEGKGFAGPMSYCFVRACLVGKRAKMQRRQMKHADHISIWTDIRSERRPDQTGGKLTGLWKRQARFNLDQSCELLRRYHLMLDKTSAKNRPRIGLPVWSFRLWHICPLKICPSGTEP